MGILEFGIILAISSVAFCGTILPPFNYKIFENDVVPLDIKSVNFLSIPKEIYKPINDNFLMKENLPPRAPAKEYGLPKDNEIFFKPPYPPALPEISLTTTTESSITTRLEEEMHAPAEENGSPKLDEMLFKPMETITPKILLPPGLPELPPSPKIPLTTTTTTETPITKLEEFPMEEQKLEFPMEEQKLEFPMDEQKLESRLEFPMEEIHKPAEEYGPPQHDEMMFKPIETTTPKIFLPPGLPELPPAPVIPLKETTTEVLISRLDEEFPMEEMHETMELMHKPDEEYDTPSPPEQLSISSMTILPELPAKMLDEMVEILKPMEEISVTTSDGHNFNIKISVTANTNFVQPQLSSPFFVPAIQAPHPISFPTGIPQLPAIPTFPQQSLHVETPMVEISSVLPDVSVNREAPYPPAISMTETPFFEPRISETSNTSYQPAETVTESSFAPTTTTPLPITEPQAMVTFDKMQHYIPPVSTTNNAPYPPALPDSKYGQL